MPISRSVDLTPYLVLLDRIKRQDGQIVDDNDQVGRAPIIMVNTNGTGDETTFRVHFANLFIDRPIFTYGSELDPASDMTPGNFPTVNAHVVRWITDLTGPFGSLPPGPFAAYYGAVVGVVTTGLAGTKIWVSFSFKGRAQPFSNVAASSNMGPTQ